MSLQDNPNPLRQNTRPSGAILTNAANIHAKASQSDTDTDSNLTRNQHNYYGQTCERMQKIFSSAQFVDSSFQLPTEQDVTENAMFLVKVHCKHS